MANSRSFLMSRRAITRAFSASAWTGAGSAGNVCVDRASHQCSEHLLFQCLDFVLQGCDLLVCLVERRVCALGISFAVGVCRGSGRLRFRLRCWFLLRVSALTCVKKKSRSSIISRKGARTSLGAEQNVRSTSQRRSGAGRRTLSTASQARMSERAGGIVSASAHT